MEQQFAFNIWDIESAEAVIDVAAKLHRSVFLQTSVAVFKGLEQKVFATQIKRYAEKVHADIMLHLDHCTDMEFIKIASASGWDSVMYDGSKLSVEENAYYTQEAINFCKPSGVWVEAELGRIFGTEDEIQSNEQIIATRQELYTFLEMVTPNLLAVAIGTSHGLYNNRTPELQYSILDIAQEITDIPLVIHGGSGLSNEILNKLLTYKAVKKINISTDLKYAYLRGLKKVVNGDCNNFSPQAANLIIYQEISETVCKKVQLLGGDNG